MNLLEKLGLAGAIPAVALAQQSSVRSVDDAKLRANASVYAAPAYPEASRAAGIGGRVVVAVVVGTNTPASPLARVQEAHVVEAPDSALGNAVLTALKDARYMPFFDDAGAVLRVSGRVVWDFSLKGGAATVLDPYHTAHDSLSTAQLARLDLEIVDRAKELLAVDSRWNRHDTRQCPPKAMTVSLYCALELATLQLAGSFDHRGTVMDDARAALDVVTPRHPDYDHWLMGYNNDTTTTFADIRRVLDVTRAKTLERLGKPRP